MRTSPLALKVARPAPPDAPLSACPAPSVVMDFAPEGDVHACCVNAAYPLGNVRVQGLRAIWDGERAQALRAAVARGDLGYGCGSCRHHRELGTGEPADTYYRSRPASVDPAWPELMAFGLNNTCNLACVMCGGNFSSRLRALEGRPRLEPAYGDRFFDELVDFLPHLRRAEFRGGEPFLIREYQRLWQLLIDLDLGIEVQVTTNGTVWNERVEALLDQLPMQFTFSMDGLTAATNEAIRVGTDQGVVLANAQRFAAHARERGTRFDLSFCLLRQNWHELADLVAFADELGVEAHAQVVLERDHGLHRLATDELTAVVDELTRQGADLDLDLDANRRTWDQVVAWLRAEVAQRAAGALRIWEQPGPANVGHSAATRRRTPSLPRPRRGRRSGTGARLDAHRADLAAWSSAGQVGDLVTDAADRVVRADLDAIAPPGTGPLPDVVGLTFAEALDRVVAALGPHLWIADEFVGEAVTEQTVFLSPTALRDKSGLVLRLVSGAERGGRVHTLLAADTYFWDRD